MKLKKAITCGLLAGLMGMSLLTGCRGQSKNKPTVIKGFDGNVVDVVPKSGDLIATFEIEDFGTIKAVLFPEAAPVGVENFQKLCDAGYYDGLNIHRVMKGFMFQGGSENGDGTGGKAMVNGGRFSIETAQNARHFYGALCYANAGADNVTTQFYIVNSKKAEDLDSLADKVNEYIDYFEEAADYYRDAGQANGAAYYEQKADYYRTTLDWIDAADAAITARYEEKGGSPSLDGNYTVFGQVYEGFDVIDAISSVEVKDNGAEEESSPVKEIIIKNVSVIKFE